MSCTGHLVASVYEYRIHVIIALVRLITRWQYGFLLVSSLHESPMPPPAHLMSFDTVTILYFTVSEVWRKFDGHCFKVPGNNQLCGYGKPPTLYPDSLKHARILL